MVRALSDGQAGSVLGSQALGSTPILIDWEVCKSIATANDIFIFIW